MLVALEQEEQGYKKCYRGKVSGINWMQGRTNGYKQEINGRLHRCPHADDGKSIVQFYQEVTDDAIEDET